MAYSHKSLLAMVAVGSKLHASGSKHSPSHNPLKMTSKLYVAVDEPVHAFWMVTDHTPDPFNP